jgi:hypothetical protein
MEYLTDFQKNVIDKTNEQGIQNKKKHMDIINKYNLTENELNKLDTLFDNMIIAVNFPNRVITKLAKDTHYRNQFETKTSKGTYDPTKRRTWEKYLFYNQYDDKPDFDRPKYGNLQIGNDKSDRRIQNTYGECHLVLKKSVMDRCTFTYGDSALNYDDKYVHLFKYAYEIYQYITKTAFISLVKTGHANLSIRYIEIQIHGEIKLDRDILKIVAPTNYKNTDKEQDLQQLAKQHNISLEWQ